MTQLLDLVMVDSMTDAAFKGNPTPVLIIDSLREWPPEQTLQTIAREMNQSETIFVKRASSMKDGTYLIRSFTPYQEEPFCGHGLLAAALLLRCNHPGEEMSLRTIDGIMVKARSVASDSSESAINMYGEPYQMKLEMPAVPVTESFDGDVNVRTKIAKSLGVTSSQILGLWRNALMDVVIELDPGVDFSAAGMDLDAVELMHASPAGTRSQVITSRGDRHGVDFLERVFAYGSEDQATGSTYCVLIPYWTSKLNKSLMRVKQVSERTGVAETETMASEEGYVVMTGSGVKVMEGRILVPGSK